MHYGKTNRKADYNLGGVQIVEVSEKDLGVTFDQQLSFDINASKVVAGANSRLGLINRHFRHTDVKGHVIQTYKITNNIDRIDGKKFFKPCKEVRTGGHSKRVEKTQCKSLVRRNTFSQRMANDWDALPDAVVMSGSINQFKGRLGRWWKNDPILYQTIRSPRVTKHSAIAIYNAREGHQPC